jgi:hypothetical protein
MLQDKTIRNLNSEETKLEDYIISGHNVREDKKKAMQNKTGGTYPPSAVAIFS